MGLPTVVRGERVSLAIDVVTSAPAQYELGPAHRVAVEEIGETPRTSEPSGSFGQLGERAESVVVASRPQHLEHGPDETVDLPRIGNPVVAPSREHCFAQRTGESELDVRRNTVSGPGPGRAE